VWRRPLVRRAALPGLIGLLTLLAWHNRFVQDDAFISFRYADNLARGLGLTWNPGERVEGYTNFLWTLALAGAARLGIDLVLAAHALGLLSCVLTLYATYRLGLVLLASRPWAMVAVVLLGTNYTFSAYATYATGGLETQLQTCLLTVMLWLSTDLLSVRRLTPARLAVVSVVAGTALLVLYLTANARVDSVIVHHGLRTVLLDGR
jgi:arabinofuranosyltransferase